MRFYIFGYGSLIIPKSAAKSLGKDVQKSEMILVYAYDLTRVWRVVAKVVVNHNGSNKLINAVFLDVKRQPGKRINGSLIEVTNKELERLDIREKQYNRVDITSCIKTNLEGQYTIYAYMAKSEFYVQNFNNPKVLKQYLDLLQNISEWGAEFYKEFKNTTENHHFPIIDGTYTFLDNDQNIVTGHSDEVSTWL